MAGNTPQDSENSAKVPNLGDRRQFQLFNPLKVQPGPLAQTAVPPTCCWQEVHTGHSSDMRSDRNSGNHMWFHSKSKLRGGSRRRIWLQFEAKQWNSLIPLNWTNDPTPEICPHHKRLYSSSTVQLPECLLFGCVTDVAYPNTPPPPLSSMWSQFVALKRVSFHLFLWVQMCPLVL